ncbi:MAG: hypothetical protein KC544_13390 [Gemmatimonadetes bacterium]|nr:hypothetical protein [Gemmatimonadota bacterium]
MSEMLMRLFLLMVMLAPVGLVVLLAVRLIRALEQRKDVDLTIGDMTRQIRALRTEASLMSDEVAALRRDAFLASGSVPEPPSAPGSGG